MKSGALSTKQDNLQIRGIQIIYEEGASEVLSRLYPYIKVDVTPVVYCATLESHVCAS